MPPPNFSPVAIAKEPGSEAGLRKSLAAGVKEVAAKIKATLAGDAPSRPALEAIAALQQELAPLEPSTDDTETGAGGSTSTGTNVDWGQQVSERLHDAMTDIFVEEMDQDDMRRCSTLVDILDALGPLVSAKVLVTDWWDLFLRPVLKNTAVSASTAGKSRALVVRAMASSAASAYVDETAPVAVWPAVDEPGTLGRKVGDAPYTMAAAASPVRPKRSGSLSGSGSGSAFSIAGAGKTVAVKQDMFRRFTQRIFDLYVSSAVHSVEDEADKEQHGVWKSNMEMLLLAYGRAEPKKFFHHMAEAFSEAPSRVCLLVLLTTFLRQHSIHIYHITHTALPKKLLLSLQLDTSETVISLGITALVMLMPHVPDWIANGGAGGLPTFLSVFARVVDWRKLGQGWEERSGPGHEAERREKDEEFAQVDRLARRLAVRNDLEWQRVETWADQENVIPPDPVQFFTFLYGLFPCNTIRFLRAPIDYLRKASYESPFEGDWEEMLDERAVQTRASKILTSHTIHPALITLSAEREVRDKQRWMRHEPADITAECISLYLGAWHDRQEGAAGQPMTFSPSHEGFRPGGIAMNPSGSGYGERDLDHSLSLAGSAPRGRSAAFELESDGFAHRRGSSAGISAGDSASPMLRPAHGVTTRTAVNADDILSTYASLKRGDPVVARIAPPPAGRIGMSRSTTWAPEAQFDHFPLASTTTRGSSARPPNSATRLRFPSEAIDVPTARTGEHRDLMDRDVSPTHISHDLNGIPRPQTQPTVYNELMNLQRENLLLRNELNFELYLKEQHLRHIGRLHRERINDTALETERQNLYFTVRSLRNQLATVTAGAEKQRAEATTIKTRHLTWENEQNVRLKTFRDERKTWVAEVQNLRAQLEDALTANRAQEAQVQEVLNARFNVEARLALAEPKLAKVEEYDRKVRQLSAALAHWQKDVERYDEQRREMQAMLSRWQEMELLLDAMDAQVAESEQREQAALERVVASKQQWPPPIPPPSKHQQPPSQQPVDGRIALELESAARRRETLEAQVLSLKAQLGEAKAAADYARYVHEYEEKADVDADVQQLSI